MLNFGGVATLYRLYILHIVNRYIYIYKTRQLKKMYPADAEKINPSNQTGKRKKQEKSTESPGDASVPWKRFSCFFGFAEGPKVRFLEGWL